MKSRIIQISIAVVLAVAALACILMQCYVKYDMGKDTEVRYPFVAGTIDIIAGSQRLFYVKNVHMGYDRDAGEYRTDMNHYNITDDHGNVLADMRELVANAKCNKLMVDHHINPEPICNPILSYPQMTSTCELLYRILVAIGYSDMIDLDVATCIYTGMMTDTGNFSYNSNHAELYIIVADLVRRGVDKDRIYKLTLGTSSEARMRLNCYAIAEKMRLFPSHKASLTILDKRDLRKFNYQVGDTEALANMPLAIPTVVWSVFFREERGFVKVSMRSEGDFHVNTLCAKYFNGGGHANAAGGEYHGPLRGAIDTFHQILRDLTENNVTI